MWGVLSICGNDRGKKESRREGGIEVGEKKKNQQAYNIIIPLSLVGFLVFSSKGKILQDPKCDPDTSFQKDVGTT